MSVLNIISMLGGLSLFLFGIKVMSGELEKTAGGKLEKILQKMTDKPFKALLLGAATTAAVQSSSAVTVMLVGLVNSGIMSLGQTVGVIMGANIGTTVTAWILSLAGIRGDSLILNLLKPSSFSPIIAFIGILMIMISKKSRVKDAGIILMGFAVLMFGMQIMSESMAPLAETKEFRDVLPTLNNPFLGLAVGTVATVILQSSSATVGVLQALSVSGVLTYGTTAPIIAGQNVGACVTAVISSVGTSVNAKRTAAVHVYFNLIGAAIFLSGFCVADRFFDFSFFNQTASPAGIAFIHSSFNLFFAALLFPFSKGLERLAVNTIRSKNDAYKRPLVDDRLLDSPSLAVAEGREYTVKMARIAGDALLDAISLLENYDRKKAEKIEENEQALDDYEDKLGTFLVKISGRSLAEEDGKIVSTLLHSIGDFERIGDHAVNIMQTAKEICDKQIAFSDEAKAEMKTAAAAVAEIISLTLESFANSDVSSARKVEPLEEVIDDILAEIKDRHIARLTRGECSVVAGFVLSDLLADYERVSDHCSNVAVAVIQISRSVFDAHEYLNDYKTSGNEAFTSAFSDYKRKYALP